MAMLPIFLLGFALGLVVSGAYILYKKSTPSEVQLYTLQQQNERQKEDILALELQNEKLYKQLSNIKTTKTTRRKKTEE